MKSIFNNNGIAIQEGEVTIYNFDPVTLEFRGESIDFVPEGMSIVANATLIQPNEGKDGFTQIFNHTKWIYIEDFRGTEVYHKETHEKKIVDYIGPIQKEFTDLAPSSEFDMWSSGGWVKDETKEEEFLISQAESQKAHLLSLAADKIAPLQDAADLDEATEDELTQLKVWKKYRVLVNRVDTSLASDIVWPEFP